ncbi:hypothetical protein B0J13DRAFT_677886 [Dactylonectria estremocensis]|uniref:Secreted protein n=1 Tax=Dactylonectria estremocensis TaxID=1079267 RepID=A0A9P9EBV5_9HYPO|nr:hypothetical protein B0J13DRAFT_677886 [Dactylonectria estremocensis]
MIFLSTLILSFVTAGFSTPIVLRLDNNGPPENATFIPCVEGTTDPICLSLRQPSSDVITEIVHANGTVETKHNRYTREELKEIRHQNKVRSTEYRPGEVVPDQSAEFISNLTKRESAPPVCWTEKQRWYDQNDWGYWYQAWHQVGNCFYCDQCTEAIAVSFAVSETWTYGLSAEFGEVITASFSFAWGETRTLTDTRTCQWNFVESGCHSIWYQPLMAYHNGYANYQTHTHCGPGQGNPASDSYYNHNWAFANVNQIGNNNGVNQGNLGCNSGCQGNDHRQCQYGNNGGSLWPYAN